ncbi:hypothetical protein METBIDRAFT_30712 [Metschnikowia bicuspidata var. bicuspidata NRRL YB-4993]|uniref:DNA2/NAM7 helicase helicase domain-containing protein n=1 Tax=Metschnikowia bicuspidata var. bicuspidata NRRL YB-4993 TaxID=869754 RepID=A0A1A0HKA6_9ASCO|nr:hypothetical protein METBIDRAFT_30712 [Metschnikowia bicuspidata var. bicuspidata NRRL YB-4993]OBA24436.1 hypothetical protein METBIDRAFT_30712 [Metschnikowia bicuspidata var. bicuspidata NRRL YB-4993]
MADNNRTWYCIVTSSEIEQSGSKNYKDYFSSENPSFLKVDVQLFHFNVDSLPVKADVSKLKILPASVPLSRMFKALAEIKKSDFRDIILGKSMVTRSLDEVIPDLVHDRSRKSKLVQSILKNPVTIVPKVQNVTSEDATLEVVKELLENRIHPILVVSTSNVILDKIAQKMLPTYKNSIVRIVASTKEFQYNRGHKILSVCLHNMVYDAMSPRIKSFIRKMRDTKSSLSWSEYRDMKSAQIPHFSRILSERDVIFTTPVSAGSPYFKDYTKKPIVVMDDASQSSEVSTLIPLLLSGVLRFVFIGEPRDTGTFSQVPDMSFSHFQKVLNGM